MLIFDIETEGRPEAIAALPEPTAPANYKDEAKIAAYIAQAKIEQAAKAALDPDAGRVSAIGMCAHGGLDEPIYVFTTGPWVPTKADREALTAGYVAVRATLSEAELLDDFWQLTAGGPVCGYNIIGFDIPYLQRRSMALRNEEAYPAATLPLARYRDYPVRDLYGLLYNWGPGKGLKAVAKLYGFQPLFPDLGDLDGGDYATMDPLTRVKYLANDVHLTRQLHQMMAGWYFPVRAPEKLAEVEVEMPL